MRSLLRKLAALSSATALIFFCSCERHKPDELHHAEHAAPGAKKHGKGDGHGKSEKAHEKHAGKPHPKGEEKQGAPAHAASPVGTPANFFPSSPSPSPR